MASIKRTPSIVQSFESDCARIEKIKTLTAKETNDILSPEETICYLMTKFKLSRPEAITFRNEIALIEVNEHIRELLAKGLIKPEGKDNDGNVRYVPTAKGKKTLKLS